MQVKAARKIRKIPLQKNGTYFLAITSGELIDKEACYHASCYRVYTRPTSEELPNRSSNYNTYEEFCNVWKILNNLFDNSEVRGNCR